MEWIPIILLVIVILIINNNFRKIANGIEENTTRYDSKFTDIEVRIAKMESKIKD